MAAETELRKWLVDLNRGLDKRKATIDLFRNYYEGIHRSMFETAKYREEFGWLTAGIRVNFCVLVVDAARERLSVAGFRFGNDDENDEAWRIWQANKLDARSDIAHTEALINGLSYILVAPDPKRDDTPRITVEDARNTIVAYDPENVDRRLAGLKRVLDDDGFELAWLYLPDGVFKFRSRSKATATYRRGPDYWVPRQTQGEPWPLPNPLETVSLIPLVNNPTVQNDGRSELQSVVAIQDMLNKLASDLIIASEFVAYPQRWVTGVEVPIDPKTNEPIEPFKAGVNRFLVSDGENVKFGQFPEGSLTPYVSAIEMFTQQIATITKTPPHYLLGQSGNFPSGESLKSTETGLVSKVRQEQRFFGETWEEGMKLALKLTGKPVENEDTAEVVWKDPENRVQSELTDAVSKENALGVPFEFLMEKLGYSQVEIQRMKVMKLQDALENQTPVVVGAPTATFAKPPVQTPPNPNNPQNPGPPQQNPRQP